MILFIVIIKRGPVQRDVLFCEMMDRMKDPLLFFVHFFSYKRNNNPNNTDKIRYPLSEFYLK